MKLFGHIPFATLAQRHLVYAYCTVWLLQFGYAGWLRVRFHKEQHSA